MSEQLLEITPAEELRGKSMLVSVTFSLSVPLEIFHPLATWQLKIFSILSRDCNTVIVPANVIVRGNCWFQCFCLILIETFMQVMGSTHGMNQMCESLLKGLCTCGYSGASRLVKFPAAAQGVWGKAWLPGEMCEILIKTESSVLLCQKSHCHHISPGQGFETGKCSCIGKPGCEGFPLQPQQHSG